MEILKNFVFDLQRHAVVDVKTAVTLSTPSSAGDYYYDVTSGSLQTTPSSLSANSKYLRVNLSGSTYTLSGVTTDASAKVTGTCGVVFASGMLTLTSNIQDASVVIGTSAKVSGAILLNAPTSGYSITLGTTKLTAADASTTFRIASDGTGIPTVTSGAAYLNYNNSKNVVWSADGSEAVTATNGSIIVSKSGSVYGLDASDAFTIEATGAASTSGFTYTVGKYGQDITLADAGEGGTAKSLRYLLTSDPSDVTVTMSKDNNADTVSNAIAVTGSAGVIYAAGAATSGGIYESSEGTAYAYVKGTEIIWSGTNDSGKFGQFLGSVSADNNGAYAFDGASSAVGETLTGADVITTILSGSGNDSIDGAAYTKAVTIDAGTGNDTIGSKVYTGASIVGGAGNDSVNVTIQGSAATINLGDGNNTLSAAGTGADAAAGGEWTVTAGAGNDSIALGTLGTNTHSYWDINVGDGNNSVTLGTKVVFSTVVAGSGNDTIASYAASNSLVGGSGSDVFDISVANTAANISDYEYGADSLLVANAADTNANTIAKTATAAGVITDTGTATVSGSNGVFAVTVADAAGNKVDIGWTGENGTSIDASSATRKAILVGTKNEVGDTLVGGSKADTIYAGASDSVYGGAGNDLISIDTTTTYGVYVGFSTAGGKDTVQNFSTGWDIASADEVYVLDESSVASLQGGVTGNDVTLKSGTATMTLSNAANGKSEVQALINEKKVDLIKENTIINVTDDSTLADYYIGTTKSGISLSKYTSDVEVNLAGGMFRNITTVEGGAGSTSILGGKAAESLKGGTGESSLYGGAGVDTLVSGDGKTTFFATSESGKDVVTGFVVGTEDTSDVLNVSSIAGVSRDNSTNFTLKVDNSNSLKVTQKSGGVDSNIQWVSGDAKGVAKIGTTGSNNTFSYDATTTNYIGGNKTDIVSVASGATDNFNVWLDQTGAMFSSIEVYDMKNTSGSVLMAGKADTAETIIGGQSNTSLWGGAGNTVDVLKSTSGSTTDFFYGLGEGNDSISGSSNDTMNLYNINLSDITKADINSSSVVFTTTANNTVTVNGSVGTFKLADGTAWTANYSSKTWSAAE